MVCAMQVHVQLAVSVCVITTFRPYFFGNKSLSAENRKCTFGPFSAENFRRPNIRCIPRLNHTFKPSLAIDRHIPPIWLCFSIKIFQNKRLLGGKKFIFYFLSFSSDAVQLAHISQNKRLFGGKNASHPTLTQ